MVVRSRKVRRDRAGIDRSLAVAGRSLDNHRTDLDGKSERIAAVAAEEIVDPTRSTEGGSNDDEAESERSGSVATEAPIVETEFGGRDRRGIVDTSEQSVESTSVVELVTMGCTDLNVEVRESQLDSIDHFSSISRIRPTVDELRYAPNPVRLITYTVLSARMPC